MSDIAAIRERWSNATIGPWEWDTNAYEWQRYRLWRPIGCHEVIVVTYDGQGNESMNVSNADAVAIAAAPTDIATLLAEVDRLRDVATGPYLIMDEREGIIGIVNATDYDEAWAKFQAANPGDYDGEPDDNEVLIEAVTLEWCDKMVDWLTDAHEKIYRLTSELSAAQTELQRSRVSFEWSEEEVTWSTGAHYETRYQSRVGRFRLLVKDSGWTLYFCEDANEWNDEKIDEGKETGKEGKAACIAAYYAAIGLPCP